MRHNVWNRVNEQRASNVPLPNNLRNLTGNSAEMAKKPIDRRVARTRAMLQQAHISLILKKGYDAITVDDICNVANVGPIDVLRPLHEQGRFTA